jgi:hypothetical protein
MLTFTSSYVRSVAVATSIFASSAAFAATESNKIDERSHIAQAMQKSAQQELSRAAATAKAQAASANAQAQAANLPNSPAITAGAQMQALYNPSDLWYNPSESGWGISMNYNAASNQMFAVWYTYDPRRAAGTGVNEPLWIVIPGGTWTTSTVFDADAYVTRGTFFGAPWSGSEIQKVGTVKITFSSANTATFEARIAPPAVTGTNPAVGLPAFVVNKPIQRLDF